MDEEKEALDQASEEYYKEHPEDGKISEYDAWLQNYAKRAQTQGSDFLDHDHSMNQ